MRQVPGYIAREVECESRGERRYRVRDFWCWHRYFERFRERLAAEYEKFARLLVFEGLVEREQASRAYYEREAGDGDELVAG